MGEGRHEAGAVPVEGHEGLEAVRLTSPEGLEAVFVPGAGLVGTRLALHGVDVLAARHGLAGYADRASTFGIPLLAPWANRLSEPEQTAAGRTWRVEAGAPGVHPDDNGLPIHGLLAAAAGWEVEQVTADDDAARLVARFRFGPHLDLFPSFPFAHDLVVEVTVAGTVLRVATTLEAGDAGAVPVAFGWHPWFRFDAPRAGWTLHAPLSRHAVLDERNIPTGEVRDEPVPQGALGDVFLDDVYLEVADGTEVAVAGGDHEVVVRYVEGYDVAVVYAPLVEDVVCVEPMTAPTDPFRGWWPLRTVEPGGSYRAVFEVDVCTRA